MPIDASVDKQFGKEFHLAVDFSFNHGCLGILGASGSGKSMLLKCLAGVETPDHGRIAVNGRVLFDADRRVNVRPQERRVGILFQHYALFPNMTVKKNIGIGVDGSAEDKAAVVAEFVHRFRLEGMEHRFPAQLSGGQQQRVALARMLAARPEVILLDEPFSALDAHLHEQVRLDMLDVVRSTPNVVMVTHNAEDAYKMCGELIVLDKGRVVGRGETKTLFRDPGHVRVAEITGCGNVSRMERLGERTLRAVDWGMTLESAGEIPLDARFVGIREQDFEPLYGPKNGHNNVLEPCVRDRVEDPFTWSVVFTSGGGTPDERREMWWKVDKRSLSEFPQRLRMPPEALLFLRDG